MDTRKFFLLKILDWVQMSRKERDLIFTKRKIINHVKRVLHCCVVQSLGHVWLFVTQWTQPNGTQSLPVFHCLPEFAQTHVHWVNDAIQPSRPLSPPSPSTLNLSQHQGLFHWVSSSHQVAKVLELQHHSFQWIFGVDFLEDWLISLLSKGLPRAFSSTTGYYNSHF